MVKYRNCVGMTMLAVDEDKVFLKFFKIHFGNVFNAVIIVNNEKDALSILRSNEIDLVISSYYSFNNNGLSLAKKIKQKYPNISLILTSEDLLKDDQLSVINQYCDGFLTKPFAIGTLKKEVMKGVSKRNIYLSSIKNKQTPLGQESIQSPKMA